jgi:hypothetical protein
VEKPEGYDLITWFDFSPMRPDEYAATDAERWTEALELRNVIEDARARARDEGQTSATAG